MNSSHIENPDLVADPKPLTFALLKLLADGEFHSGEILAQRLNMSRASVSNALSGVAQYGLSLYSVRGRGYCLKNPPQWLDAELINAHLGSESKNFNLEILDSVISTNTLMLQRAAQGALHGSVLAAEWQSKGRGRLGRSWHSGLGNALTFSLLWRFECGLSGLSGLSLVIGVALMRTLKKLGVSGVELKWPNDVLGKDGKLAGILVEAQGDMLGPSAVIIGIGMNLMLPEELRLRIDQSAGDLSQQTGKSISRNELFASVLQELGLVLKVFSQNGFASFREEWENYHRYHQQTVQLILPDGKTIEGKVSGVNNEGALMLEIESLQSKQTEIQFFHSGEISLRGIEHAAV